MKERQGQVKNHHLLRTTKLPAQKGILSSVDNKKQLIQILFEKLTQERLYHQQIIGNHALVVTGKDPCPIEIKG